MSNANASSLVAEDPFQCDMKMKGLLSRTWILLLYFTLETNCPKYHCNDKTGLQKADPYVWLK